MSHVVSLKTPPPSPPPPPPERPESRPKKKSRSRYLVPIITLLIVTGIAVLVSRTSYFTSPHEEAPKETANESADLITRVSALIELPQGAEPTIATVTDPEKLKSQAFFARAKVGDKVLIYTQARKAYLYDPTANKLLEVAPLTTDIQQ